MELIKMNKKVFAPVILAGIIALAGCNKETVKDNSVSTTTNTSNITSEYFISGMLDSKLTTIQGTPAYFTDLTDAAGSGHNTSHDLDGDHDDNFVTGSRWMYTSPTGVQSVQGTIQLKKLSVRVYVAPIQASTHDQYFAMVQPGNLGFANSATSGGGVYLTITDVNGTVWTSAGDQTGSLFQITQRGTDHTTYTSFSGIFTAKMYDGNGNSKLFSNVAFNAMAGL